MNSKIFFISIFAILLISSVFAEEVEVVMNEDIDTDADVLDTQYTQPDPSDLIIGVLLIMAGIFTGMILFNHFGLLVGFGIIATGIVYVLRYVGVWLTPYIMNIWSSICSIF